jgi:hypothetical protein
LTAIRAVVLLVLGIVLTVASVVGFVIAPEHVPVNCGRFLVCGNGIDHGWSRTIYDAVRIGTWTALIIGFVLLACGLIVFARRSTG